MNTKFHELRDKF